MEDFSPCSDDSNSLELPVNAVEEDTQHASISIEEYIEEQASDAWCRLIGAIVDAGPTTRLKRDDRGLLVRIDLSHQVGVHPALRSRVLHLAHYPRLSGHPGTTRMYQTLRREFYWPSTALAVLRTVRSCSHCAKERLEAQTPQQVA